MWTCGLIVTVGACQQRSRVEQACQVAGVTLDHASWHVTAAHQTLTPTSSQNLRSAPLCAGCTCSTDSTSLVVAVALTMCFRIYGAGATMSVACQQHSGTGTGECQAATARMSLHCCGQADMTWTGLRSDALACLICAALRTVMHLYHGGRCILCRY